MTEPVHFFAFDPRFCGTPEVGVTRRVSPDAGCVTCPSCRAREGFIVIEYRGDRIPVEVIQHDDSDEDMPLLFWFPKDHDMYCPEGVWLQTSNYRIVESVL